MTCQRYQLTKGLGRRPKPRPESRHLPPVEESSEGDGYPPGAWGIE
jgi:hypothetical protein